MHRLNRKANIEEDGETKFDQVSCIQNWKDNTIDLTEIDIMNILSYNLEPP